MLICFYTCRYEDVSTVMVRNSHLDLMDQDILYHLALGSGSHDLRAMFGDVKVQRSRHTMYCTLIAMLFAWN